MPVFGERSGKASKLETIEDFERFAELRGIKLEKKEKTSLFRKTIDILQRPNYAVAGFFGAFTERGKAARENPLQEAWDGLTGREKETFSDVLKDVGVENKYARGIAGFALDVALDPTTYIGGPIIKGIARGTGAVAKGAAKTAVGEAVRAIPQVKRLETAGKTVREALGEAFVFGRGAPKGFADDLVVGLNKLGIKKEEVINKYTKSFGTKFNKYSNDEILEAGDLLMKNRVIEKSIKEGAKDVKFKTSKNPKINEIVTKLKGHGAEIAKDTDLPLDKIYENYFPAIAKDRTKDVFGRALTPKESGGTQQWNNILKIGDDALDNPVEALARRELEVGRFNINKETIKHLVDAYGSKTPKEGLEKVVMKKFDGNKLIDDPMGFLPKKAKAFMNDMLYPEMKTLDMLAKASGYDTFTNFFKGAVTAWFPAFHIRNAASGIVQNYSVLGAQALNPKNFMDGLAVMKKANRQFLFKGFKGTAGELRDKMAERFGVSSRYISDLGDYVTELADGSFKLKNMSKLNPRRLGNWIEMNQKSNATIAALRQGKSLDEAFKLAEKAGFDYSKITNFESKIMKRIIPFYSFARKNAELQVKTFAKHPERILNQVKFTNLLSNIFGGDKPTEEDLAGLPPWALNAMGFKIQDGKYISKFGLPMEEFVERVADPIKTSLTSMNPLIKFPLEAQTGYDFFREKQIEDITTIKEPTAKAIMNHGPQWLKDAFNVTSYEYKGETKYKADPDALHVLRNIPISRFLNTFDKMAKDGVLEVTPEKAASFIIGAQLYSIDQELQKYFSDKELVSDYQKQLEQQGVGWDYTQFFGR